MTKRRMTSTLAVLALVGLIVAGCGGGGDPAGEASSESDETDGTDGTTSSPETSSAGWEEVVPGGDCQCSDGSEFNLWVRGADPNKVLVYYDGGGACWTAEMCAQPATDGGDGYYSPTVDDGPPPAEGILALGDDHNPFADWSVVFVPYCTGDVFVGNATTEYAPGVTIQHKGYANGNAALDHVASAFPDATQVVVAGLSAGSVSAPLYGGLASDRFPDANITVLSDGSGSYSAAVADDIAGPWGVADAIPDWPENAGLTGEQWASPPGLYIQAGRHDPDITFARHDFAYDAEQVSRNQFLGIPGDLLSLIDATEAEIEAAGVALSSYVAPGADHGVIQDDSFYEEEVEGVALVDWVTTLVEGTPVADVHCTTCDST